ncbi:hemin-degrading factor [Serratia sp. UGAL515B_01]|uniref:hemin-degrading factor n=1 Tax=Serratia sp. UGAL515B_01 TaxID=2986763 RepID=UPI00295576DC|nr:ChuX/HutX family heme-like substrate-binding protein [Serratia sp. UGAL515B_01]WON78930.1 hemin-degrading factor [Serratia sp. UGAL515B_01]
MNETLYQRYQMAKNDNPGKYARDLASLLNVSEAELIHARVGHDAQRLQADARTLLAALEQVGITKSITRNRFAVHEQIGRYQNQYLNGHAGLILNPRELDLRLFLNHWASAFALTETNKRGVRHSIQFFDHQGEALHKVYTTDETHLATWQTLIERYQSAENPRLELRQPEENNMVHEGVDTTKIDTEWRAMTDVHQFFQLLSRNNLSRQQAFRAVGNDLAYRVDNHALSQILQAAQTERNEIMIFVGNRGCVQIFTGHIERLMPQDGWLNIFNRHFVLHLIEDAIAESWITRKPTTDGMVTSLELFAADGTQIAQLYGQRTEGQPEQTQWRQQIARLEPKDIAA